VRDDTQLRVLDVAAGTDRLLADGFIQANPDSLAWSPDGRWIAYLGLSTRSFRNAYVVPTTGGESRAVSAIPNANTNTLSWSPDGKFLVFNTSQRTEDTEVVRVDLTLETPTFEEDEFRELFADPPARGRGGRGDAATAEPPADVA
jgi:tricorn protease